MDSLKCLLLMVFALASVSSLRLATNPLVDKCKMEVQAGCTSEQQQEKLIQDAQGFFYCCLISAQQCIDANSAVEEPPMGCTINHAVHTFNVNYLDESQDITVSLPYSYTCDLNLID